MQQEYSYQLVAKDAEIAMIGEEKRRCQVLCHVFREA